MRISAVIPVWNGRMFLEKLFASVAAQTLAFAEIIVIDNGSTDGAGDFAKTRGAKVVRFVENRGFAVAVNRGMAETAGDLIAILNSDVELAPDWTEMLARAISPTSVFFAAGRILSKRTPEKIDGCWDLVSRAGMPWRVGHGATADHPAFRESRSIPMASFTALLIRRELWKRIGPLDERFETYLEDVDFGLRCAAAQLPGAYEPDAICFHHGSAALGQWSQRTVRLLSRNQVFLVRKHLNPGWWTLLIGQGLWGLLAFRQGAGLAWLQGKWEAWGRRKEFQRFVITVESQEQQILALQARMGFDTYWRWYAQLTGAGLRLNDTRTDRE